MKVTVLYTSNTPLDRDLDRFDLRLTELQVPHEMVDADSRNGAAISELYEALMRPTVLLTTDDGQLSERWQGDLPTPEEVAGRYRVGS
jgi:hypothetical protein